MASDDVLGVLTDAEREDFGSLLDGSAGHYRQSGAAKCIRRLCTELAEARRETGRARTQRDHRMLEVDPAYVRGKADGANEALDAVSADRDPVGRCGCGKRIVVREEQGR